MIKSSGEILFLILSVIALLAYPGHSFAENDKPVKGWPRLYESDGNKVVVHQPQLDDWQDYQLLRGKAATVVELKGNVKEYYGVMKLQAQTEVDFETRTVLLKNFQVTAHIPGPDLPWYKRNLLVLKIDQIQ